MRGFSPDLLAAGGSRGAKDRAYASAGGKRCSVHARGEREDDGLNQDRPGERQADAVSILAQSPMAEF